MINCNVDRFLLENHFFISPLQEEAVMQVFYVHENKISQGTQVSIDEKKFHREGDPDYHVMLGHNPCERPGLKIAVSQDVIDFIGKPCSGRGEWVESKDGDEEPPVCTKCGTKYGPWQRRYNRYVSFHPVDGIMYSDVRIMQADLVPMGDGWAFEPQSPDNMDSILIHWMSFAGYNGRVGYAITEGQAKILLVHHNKISPQSFDLPDNGMFGVAEAMVVMKPGSVLESRRTGYCAPAGLARVKFGADGALTMHYVTARGSRAADRYMRLARRQL